jgi:phosphoglycolate phosphatase
MKKNYTNIIWDWNGTLFDDVNWSIRVINSMLAIKGIKPVNGIADYHNKFCFPIIDYYRNVGFDFEKEPFERLAKEYISLYHANLTGGCKLHDGAESMLKYSKESGIKQIILSASEISNLLDQINEFDIKHYFDEIIGISNIYAKGKIETGLDFMQRNDVKSAVLIGDTAHDYEVAKALGVDCLLIAGGHQSRETLLKCGVPVLESIAQVVDYI